VEENCSCRPEFAGKNRQRDRELRQQGIPCYPTTEKTLIKSLIYRSIELKTSLGHGLKQASQVIEVYPFASKVRLFGKAMPQKTTRQGIGVLRNRLGILPSLNPYLGMMNHDLCDAAVAAYTGLLYHRNRAKALGDCEEGLILIPD
jgi:predicted nuclease with RNAse H fold